MERQKVKKSPALAEIRGLFLAASALANWGRLTDDEKRHTADRIERLILRTVPNEQITELECRRCGDQKPVSDFNKSVHSKSGYESWCRKCKNEYMREWQKKRRIESGLNSDGECGAHTKSGLLDCNGDELKAGDMAMMTLKVLGEGQVEIVEYENQLQIFDKQMGYYPLIHAINRSDMIIERIH